ncbi:MAG: T9SS type A sorting domain-containing protein [Bacteroidota bacterium]
MKNRNLLIGLLVLMIGTGLFMLTTSGTFRQIGHFPVPGMSADGIPDGWSYFSQIRSNQVTGYVNPADVIKARKQAAGLKSTAALGLNWLSMGPDNFSGRTRALILDNRVSNRSTIFAGSVSGGLWKSTTRGLTWNPVETGNILLNVSCMAQASNGDIYVGSGESFASERFNLFSGFIGHGVYKSSDGITFSKLASTDPGSLNNPDAEWAFVNKIAAGENNKVFAATNAGLKYSSDGGNSWALASTGEESLTEASTDVKIGSDGTVAASVGNQLYISSTGDVNGFVLRSTGTGQDSLPVAGLSRIEVAFAPSDPSVIYAVLIADGTDSDYLLGQLQGVYISKDKGITWRLIGPGASELFNVFGNAANTIHRGNYSACIEVNPSNPDLIYLGGVNVWEGKKIEEAGFYQWQQKSAGAAGSYFHSIIPDPVNTGTFYLASDRGLTSSDDNLAEYKNLNRNYLTSMFYTVAFDDKGRALGGSQGDGIIFLDKEGNTPETGLQILTTFVDGDIKRPIFYGGTVEMSMINPSAMYYSSSAGYMKRSADLGFSEANAFIPAANSSTPNVNVFLTPFRMWESFNNENSRDSVMFHAETDLPAGAEVIVKSKTAHSSSKKYPFKHILTENLATGDSVRVKDIISSRFFVGVTNAVYMTKEALDFSDEPKWFKIAAVTGIPSCMAYSSDANYLFVGTTDGKIIRVANIALAYDSLRADISSTGCIISSSVINTFTDRYVTSISVDPHNDSHVIVTLGNYGNSDFIFRTTDALAQSPVFNSVQGDLPAMPVYASIIEMTNSNRVIIGTDIGVFTSESIGSTNNWTAENNGMGALPVMMIRQQTLSRPWIEDIGGVNNLGAIYIATHGKGIYENRLYVGVDGQAVPPSVKNNTFNVFPNPVSTEINVELELSTKNPVLARIYNLKGDLVNIDEFGSLSKGKHLLTIPSGGLNQGTYLLQLTIGNEVKTAKFVVVK